MHSFDDFYCFALVIEHGGFNAAERATNIPKSKLSRRIHHLEQSLGVRLIQRNSRQFVVTEMGLKIYEQAKIMQNAVQTAQDIVHQLSESPRGTVRVSVPPDIIPERLDRILPKFLQQYPDVYIHLNISNRRFDVINENIDIALRVRDQLDNDHGLVIRRFGYIEQHLCASPAYLAQYGTPTHPQELLQHRTMSMLENHIQQEIELISPQQQKVKFSIKPQLTGSNLTMLCQLAIQNCGIALLPDDISKHAIQSGQLVYVLPQWHAPHGIFHMVYPSRQGILPAVKVLIDFLVKEFSA